MEFSSAANKAAESKPLIYFPALARSWRTQVQWYSLRSIDNDNAIACQIPMPPLDSAVLVTPRLTLSRMSDCGISAIKHRISLLLYWIKASV